MVTKAPAGDDYVAEFPTNQAVIDALNNAGITAKEDAAEAALMAQAIPIPGATDSDTARQWANMFVGMDPQAQGRPWKIFEKDNTWYWHYTKQLWDTPTKQSDARRIVAELNAGFPSKDGGYEWRVGGFDTKTGVYSIEMAKIGSELDDALDPDNPLMMGSDGTPTTIDLGNGQLMGFLADGRSFTVDPADTDTEIDWSNLKSGDVKTVKAGDQEFAVFPDGTKYQVGEKFAGGVDPNDVELVSQVPLADGTFAAVFNNGQIFRTGREQKPASVEYSSATGKFQVTQPDGSLNFIDPTYETGFTGQGGLEGYNMFQQRTGEVQDLGLPEVPARIEQQAGQQFIRGTQGELQPLNDVLDRVIEQAVISGDVDRAIAFDDFRKRPSRADALQMALQYARSPADQTLISAISSGEQYVAPPPAGELQQVGPPADFLQQAYQEFRDSMSGGALPTPEEMEAAMAPPPMSELDAAKLKGIELQNQKMELEIANLQQKGEDDHIAATTKVNNANKTTDARVASTQNADNIATQNYEDSVASGGDPVVGGAGEQNYGTGSQFNQSAAMEAAWNQMSVSQKALWGNSFKTFSSNAGAFKTAGALNAALDAALVASGEPTLGYKNDELYQTWLEKSGGLNHSAVRRRQYDSKTPAEWRAILGMEELEEGLEEGLKQTGTATGATSGDAGYLTEEGSPELYDPGTPTLQEANMQASQDVEADIKQEEAAAATGEPIVERMSIDELREMRGIDFPTVGTVKGVNDIWSGGEEGVGLEGLTDPTGAYAGSPLASSFAPYETADADDYLQQYAPFSMASEEDDDAPGRVMSGLEHAQAVKQERDLAEGIYRPGYPGYEEMIAKAGSQEMKKSLAEVTRLNEEAKAAEVAEARARQEQRARVNALGVDPDFNVSQITNPGYYSAENVAIREAIADAPLAAHEALQNVSLLDLANTGTEAIAGFTGDVAGMVADDPGMLVPSTASAAVQALGSGIQQAYGSTIGALGGFIGERFEERREERREAQKEPEPIPYGEGRLGTRTKPNQMTLVGEEGPEIALFPEGTEIIPMKRKVKPSQAKRLKRRGVRGMQEGGLVFPGVDDVGEASSVDLSKYGGSLPSGVRRTIMGQSIAPSRGYLSRAAGITLPSAQAMRNMLPEEMDILQDLAAQTRIPERAFQKELALGIPSGERRRGSARFLPLSLR